jgi:hypothetical protein
MSFAAEDDLLILDSAALSVLMRILFVVPNVQIEGLA